MKRFRATRTVIPRWMNLVRAVSSEGAGRLAYFKRLRGLLDRDSDVSRYFDRRTVDLPEFYAAQVRRDLGPLFEWVPAGAVRHDPNAYLKSESGPAPADA